MAERRFRPGWKMTAFTLLLLPVTVSLGLWQLDRAEEKRRLNDTLIDRIGALPVVPGETVADFQRLQLTGRFESDHTFLLDNQTYRGAVGFGVITSFLTDDGRRWLAHRGFVAGDPARQSVPEPPAPDGRVTVVGIVWPELGLLPAFEEDVWTTAWPKIVQRPEVTRMAALLDNAVPRQIRLEAGQPGVLAAADTALNMPPSRHSGYALQWFGLAVVLGGGYLYFGFRRQSHDGRR